MAKNYKNVPNTVMHQKVDYTKVEVPDKPNNRRERRIAEAIRRKKHKKNGG